MSDGIKPFESKHFHIPVLLHASIEGLAIRRDGVYVDATFGGGGHSQGILNLLEGGRLIAFDQDQDAKQQADKIQHRSFTFCQANFRYVRQYLKLHGIMQVDGVLADLGVSSNQFDIPERGFSIRHEGPLDMRMNQRSEKNAEAIVANYSEAELHRVFGQYGELRNARSAAKAIAIYRASKAIKSTVDLKDALKEVVPKGREHKYFAQVFQALRIEVNEELVALENFLHQCGEIIKEGGRLVVLSYHSLEDRLVKRYMQSGHFDGLVKKDFYGNKLCPFVPINKKPIVPSDEEIENNKRARSAKLRIAERRK